MCARKTNSPVTIRFADYCSCAAGYLTARGGTRGVAERIAYESTRKRAKFEHQNKRRDDESRGYANTHESYKNQERKRDRQRRKTLRSFRHSLACVRARACKTRERKRLHVDTFITVSFHERAYRALTADPLVHLMRVRHAEACPHLLTSRKISAGFNNYAIRYATALLSFGEQVSRLERKREGGGEK